MMSAVEEVCQLFLSDRIILQDKEIDGGVVVDKNGKIEAVIDRQECEEFQKSFNDRLKTVDIPRGSVLMAGVVDSHVHVNEPGRTAWEGFRTATAAAAAAGATTIVDMPLNSIPPTTTLENLKIKAESAKDSVFVDVGFWGGVIPGNENELKSMVDAGVVGFKCFLCPSGVDEFPNATAADLHKAFTALQGTGSVLAFHAELEKCKKRDDLQSDPEEYDSYLATRPPQMELDALELISQLANKYDDVRVHVVHVSAAECVPLVESIRQLRSGSQVSEKLFQRGVTAETCFHYLTLRSDLVPKGHTEYKCAPPIRDASNQEMLWKYLEEDKLNLVVSDHSPCTPELKCADFLSAWGGISSVQFGLSLFWTGARKRGLTLHHATKLLSIGPAKLCGLDNRKGLIKEGLDADFVVFEPEETFVVEKDIIKYKNKVSPYLGMELTGKVKRTYLRGKLIYDENDDIIGDPRGQLLLKSI